MNRVPKRVATIGVYGWTLDGFLEALRAAEACHRSLLAERLEAEHGVLVTHLRP